MFSLGLEMAPAGKVSMFHREGNDWFFRASLPNDIIISVEGAKFHLHKVLIAFLSLF